MGVKVVVARLAVNGVTVEMPLSGTGWFFKTGAYVQSNLEKGDKAGTVGEVTIYSVKVTHS